MAQENIKQVQASTVALEGLAEAVTRATLRALGERQLVPSSVAGAASGGLNIPTGPGGTVLGIVIPPWECPPGEVGGGILGFGPCRHHMIFGIILMPKNLKDLIPGTGGTPGNQP